MVAPGVVMADKASDLGFELYAYRGHTIDSLREALADSEVLYSTTQRKFSRAKIHQILRDRAYIGEVRYRGEWYPGNHPAIISRTLWDRVQALLGSKVYRSHDLAYGGNLVRCGHCGRAVTGKQKLKNTKSGERRYVYYRCSGYSDKGHPRVRVRESAFDDVMLDVFEQIHIEDDSVRAWFLEVLRQKAKAVEASAATECKELHKALAKARQQADKLLNIRLGDEVDAETFSAKNAELQRRMEKLKLQIDCADKGKSEHADTAVKVFELSQRLKEKWVSADGATKRHLLEIVGLNYVLDDESLTPTLRKPFDVLAAGVVSENGRGDWIRTSDPLLPKRHNRNAKNCRKQLETARPITYDFSKMSRTATESQ